MEKLTQSIRGFLIQVSWNVTVDSKKNYTKFKYELKRSIYLKWHAQWNHSSCDRRLQDVIRANLVPYFLACSRLQDSGERSFSEKKCEKGAGAHFSSIFSPIFPAATAPFPPSRARLIFALPVLNTSPLYYLRAWHKLRIFSIKRRAPNKRRNLKRMLWINPWDIHL